MADRFLVVGAGGFLGRAVHRHLEGEAVRGIARRPALGVDACDVGHPGELWTALENTTPDVLINCAVVADFASGALARQYPVNTLAPAVMARWAGHRGAHLVQVSATLVHGARTTHITPTSPLVIDTDYGRSKLLADDAVAASGCSATIVRPCGIYGSGGPHHLGLNSAIDGARAGTTPTLAGPGSARRNYVHVDDLAAMLVDAGRRRLRGTHLAAGPETLTIAELLQAVCEAYLPGSEPLRAPGSDAADQIVEHSPELLAGRPFRLTLNDA